MKESSGAAFSGQLTLPKKEAKSALLPTQGVMVNQNCHRKHIQQTGWNGFILSFHKNHRGRAKYAPNFET